MRRKKQKQVGITQYTATIDSLLIFQQQWFIFNSEITTMD